MSPCLCSFPVSRTSRLSWVLAWGPRAPSTMNHSSVGLARKEKYLPDSQVPPPQETTAGRGWWEEGRGPGKPLGVGHSTGLGVGRLTLTCLMPLGLSLPFPGPQVPRPSRKETTPNVHLVLNLRVACPSTGDLSLPHSGCSPSLPQAPLLPNLPLVPEPQAPPSSGYLACLPEHPAPHAPAESLGSTVKTPGFGISV